MSSFYNNIDKSIDDINSKPSSKKKTITVTIYSRPITLQIKLNKEDINKIKEQPLGNELIKFRKKLYKKFKSENLNLLNRNIKTLKVKIKYFTPEILLLKFASGKYKLKKNKIEIIKYFKEGTANHEFFHMATSYYFKEGKLGFCGFQQINFLKEETIGRGLNEGYTELLTSRYFNKQIKNRCYSYDVCTFFAEKLEQIVEKDRMEKFYMNADLFGLCKYLINFDEFKNILKFLLKLDHLVIHASSFNSKKYQEYYELVECYLAKWYISKKQQELDNKIINQDTFNKEVNDYINSLGNKDLYIENYVKQKEYCLK